MTDALCEVDPDVRAAAANSTGFLDSVPAEAIRRLVALAGDSRKLVRCSASWSLGSIAIGSAECREMLVDFLSGPLPENREATWNVLMAADDGFEDLSLPEQKPYVDALVSLLIRLPDNRAWACWKAGESLGVHVGGKAALDGLIAALRSPHACGRWSAVHGLSHLEDMAAIPFLEEVAKHDSNRTVWAFAREVAAYLSGDKGRRVDSPAPIRH